MNENDDFLLPVLLILAFLPALQSAVSFNVQLWPDDNIAYIQNKGDEFPRLNFTFDKDCQKWPLGNLGTMKITQTPIVYPGISQEEKTWTSGNGGGLTVVKGSKREFYIDNVNFAHSGDYSAQCESDHFGHYPNFVVQVRPQILLVDVKNDSEPVATFNDEVQTTYNLVANFGESNVMKLRFHVGNGYYQNAIVGQLIYNSKGDLVTLLTDGSPPNETTFIPFENVPNSTIYSFDLLLFQAVTTSPMVCRFDNMEASIYMTTDPEKTMHSVSVDLDLEYFPYDVRPFVTVSANDGICHVGCSMASTCPPLYDAVLEIHDQNRDSTITFTWRNSSQLSNSRLLSISACNTLRQIKDGDQSDNWFFSCKVTNTAGMVSTVTKTIREVEGIEQFAQQTTTILKETSQAPTTTGGVEFLETTTPALIITEHLFSREVEIAFIVLACIFFAMFVAVLVASLLWFFHFSYHKKIDGNNLCKSNTGDGHDQESLASFEIVTLKNAYTTDHRELPPPATTSLTTATVQSSTPNGKNEKSVDEHQNEAENRPTSNADSSNEDNLYHDPTVVQITPAATPVTITRQNEQPSSYHANPGESQNDRKKMRMKERIAAYTANLPSDEYGNANNNSELQPIEVGSSMCKPSKLSSFRRQLIAAGNNESDGDDYLQPTNKDNGQVMSTSLFSPRTDSTPKHNNDNAMSSSQYGNPNRAKRVGPPTLPKPKLTSLPPFDVQQPQNLVKKKDSIYMDAESVQVLPSSSASSPPKNNNGFHGDDDQDDIYQNSNF